VRPYRRYNKCSISKLLGMCSKVLPIITDLSERETNRTGSVARRKSISQLVIKLRLNGEMKQIDMRIKSKLIK